MLPGVFLRRECVERGELFRSTRDLTRSCGSPLFLSARDITSLCISAEESFLVEAVAKSNGIVVETFNITFCRLLIIFNVYYRNVASHFAARRGGRCQVARRVINVGKLAHREINIVSSRIALPFRDSIRRGGYYVSNIPSRIPECVIEELAGAK